MSRVAEEIGKVRTGPVYLDVQGFSPLNRMTSHSTEASSNVFLSMLDSDITEIPGLPRESLTDTSRHLTHQGPLGEVVAEHLIHSIQEFFNGELKVLASDLPSHSNYSSTKYLKIFNINHLYYRL